MSATRTCVALPSVTFHVQIALRRTGSPPRRPSTWPITITEPGIARKSSAWIESSSHVFATSAKYWRSPSGPL